jgi:ABC-type nitrate/sulfonate/bicarbonate transport system ATPase subunit
MAEIVKAIAIRPRILIFDEPTSSLTETETAKLFEIIRILRSEGLGIIYISHRMKELEILADEDRPGCRNDCSTVKSDREEPNAALHKLEALLGKLGYRMSDTVTRSYLSMLQQGRRTE